MKIVICNINIRIPCPNAKTNDEAIAEAEDYELPKEYVEDSFEIVEVIEDHEDALAQMYNDLYPEYPQD